MGIMLLCMIRPGPVQLRDQHSTALVLVNTLVRRSSGMASAVRLHSRVGSTRIPRRQTITVGYLGILGINTIVYFSHGQTARP